MPTKKLLGVVLLVAGILALAYRGFTYTKETHEANLGPLHMEMKEKEHVDIPVWAGVALAAAGGALLVMGRK
ncbi:MAG TPA: hypothetical protein VFE84_04595 [Patescibacteria group bacterium]|nr:hypothetical protein [Patescibacteria group bacterium]